MAGSPGSGPTTSRPSIRAASASIAPAATWLACCSFATARARRAAASENADGIEVTGVPRAGPTGTGATGPDGAAVMGPSSIAASGSAGAIASACAIICFASVSSRA